MPEMESVSPSASEKPVRRSLAVNVKGVSSVVVKPVPTGVRSAVGSSGPLPELGSVPSPSGLPRMEAASV